jgi:hypothetical protein
LPDCQARCGDAGDPVLNGLLGGEEQHAHGGRLGAQPAQYLQAAEVRQHDIQHDVVSDQPVL